MDANESTTANPDPVQDYLQTNENFTLEEEKLGQE
jgi:hypothetical protein